MSYPFLTDWTYERHVENAGTVYHLWSREHREGYTGYQLTHQPALGAAVDYVKPIGNGHFTSLEGMASTTGIPIWALRP